MQEQVAYIIKFAIIRIKNNDDSPIIDIGKSFRHNLVNEAINLSMSLMGTSILMTSWGCFIYYISVLPILDINGIDSSYLNLAIIIAPVYSIFTVTLETLRNLFTFFYYYYYLKISDDCKLFMSTQRIISTSHTIAWDLGSIFFKSYLSFILCTKAYDEWI